jgi:hypothetical protein
MLRGVANNFNTGHFERGVKETAGAPWPGCCCAALESVLLQGRRKGEQRLLSWVAGGFGYMREGKTDSWAAYLWYR